MKIPKSVNSISVFPTCHHSLSVFVYISSPEYFGSTMHTMFSELSIWGGATKNEHSTVGYELPAELIPWVLSHHNVFDIENKSVMIKLYRERVAISEEVLAPDGKAYQWI